MKDSTDRTEDQALHSWQIIDHIIEHVTTISQSSKLVLIVLAKHSNPNKGWDAWPGLERLSTMTSMHRNSVTRAISELVAVGLVTRCRTKTIPSHNIYSLNVEAIFAMKSTVASNQGNYSPQIRATSGDDLGQLDAPDQGEIRLSGSSYSDPATVDPAMEREREGVPNGTCSSFHERLDMNFSDAEQSLAGIPSVLLDFYSSIEKAEEAPKRTSFRVWLKRLIAEVTQPPLRGDASSPDGEDAHLIWINFLFDVCRRKVEGLHGRAEPIREMRAWMRVTCRDGWIGPQEEASNESFAELQRSYAQLQRQKAVVNG